MQNLSLHPLWHTAMPAYQHVVGIVTQTISAVAIYLMATKTPKPGRPFARYLILLQVSIALVDLNFGFLACSTGLFPLPGGLCNGILCTLFGFSGHAGVVLMQLSVSYVAAAILFCFHFKFLTILEMTRHRAVSSVHRGIFRTIVFVTATALGLLYVPIYRYLETGPEFTRKNFPSLYYLFERPSYRAFAYDPAFSPEYTIIVAATTVICLIVSSAIIAFFITRSFQLLSKQNASISDKTRRLQRKLVQMLVVQAIVPMNVLLIPLGVQAYSMIAMALTPNITNMFYCVQMTHALVHTSIVLLTTPSYREALVFWKARKKTTIASISSAFTRK